MQYWDNGDGTFTVKAWEIFYADHSSKLVYTQKIALDEWSSPNGRLMELRLLVRDHRPAIGTEIARPGTGA